MSDVKSSHAWDWNVQCIFQSIFRHKYNQSCLYGSLLSILLQFSDLHLSQDDAQVQKVTDKKQRKERNKSSQCLGMRCKGTKNQKEVVMQESLERPSSSSSSFSFIKVLFVFEKEWVNLSIHFLCRNKLHDILASFLFLSLCTFNWILSSPEGLKRTGRGTSFKGG